jgi:ABC-type branched-chain amino acid transport systems, periplasmic component
MRKQRGSALLTAAALLATACSGSIGSSRSDGGEQQALKIGVITGLTGAYAQLGEEQKNGAKLAAELVGGRAGGRPLEIIVRDDQLKPESALREAQSLVQSEQVDFLTGCVSAATTLAINQVAGEAGVPYLGTCQTEQLNRPPHYDPAVTYHLAPATSLNIKAAVPWICENLGKRLFILAADYAWGHEQVGAYQAVAREAGCTVVGKTMFPLGTTDFNPYIPQVESSGADVLVFGGAGRDQVSFMRQADQFRLMDRFKIFFTIADLSFDVELGHHLVEDTYAVSHFYWTIDDPGVQEFVGAYQERYGRPPGGYAVLLYNAVRLIAGQVAKGEATPERFRMAVENHEFNYAQGRELLRACDHQALAPVYILDGLSADEAASRGGSSEYGFREIVRTIPASEELAPSCEEVRQPYAPPSS